MPKQAITKVEDKPASKTKLLKKGKRDAEDDVEIKVKTKKQKTEFIHEKETPPKKSKKKVVAKKPLSEDESSDEEPAPVKKQPKTLKKAKAESSASKDESSSDGEPVVKKPAAVKKSKKESSSSEDESSSDEEPAPAKKEAIVKKAKKESSSSEDESSSDEESAPAKKQATTLKAAEIDNSSSEDESSSDEETAPPKKEHAVVKNVEKGKPDAKDSSSSEDESEDEKESDDDEKPPKKKAKASSPTKTSKQESSSDESSEEESEEEKVTPKKKDFDVEMVVAEQKSNAKQLNTPTTPIQGGSKTLFAGNLSFQIDRPDVENFFKEAGEVVDVRFASHENGSFKGFGHVEFASAEAAQKASKLNGKTLLGREIRLEVAAERGAKRSNGKGEGSQSKTVFVTGLDSSIGENEMKGALRDHFSGCGEITRIAVPTNWDTGVIKGIAYIDLKDGFEKALGLNGSEMGGWNIVVKEDRPRVVESGDGVDRFSNKRGHGRDIGGRDGSDRFSNRRGRGSDNGDRRRGRGRDQRGGRTSQKPSVINSAQGTKIVFDD